ncbi:hypothetical protein AB1Y20_000910 [Prymnesium parvum]|uniref:J domain-containing protein n=1 Tax=Prymnesium parvum TaxID=97485 RepID=A0AB34K804_PRYPA
MAPKQSYYNVLGLQRTATTEEVKKAYRKLALKWHPERASEPKAEVLSTFDSIAEAYEVLSNPARRAIFDQYGETGLKNGIPDGQGGVKGGKYQFNNNAAEIFAAFFGTSSPFADILGDMGSEPPAFYGELTGMQLPHVKAKPAPKVVELEVTLRELYNCVTKKITYTRKKLKHDEMSTYDEMVDQYVGLKPWWTDGLVASFPGAGDEGVDILPGDVDVAMTIAPDICWACEGSTLIYTARIGLTEALCGTILEIPCLDGRQLAIPVTQVVAPGYTKKWPGEGMPKEDGTKGNLLIKFDIQFPETLTPAQKTTIKKTLAQ